MNYENLPELMIDGSDYIPRCEIARGGMGAIFTYKSNENKKIIVVKIPILDNKLISNLPEDKKTGFVNDLDLIKDSFNYEAKLMSELNEKNFHGNTSSFPTLLAYDNHTPCIAMNYEPGKDLEFIVENLKGREEYLPFPHILHIAKQLYIATKNMHEAGYVHNDLKLANIRVRRSNKISRNDEKNGGIVLLDLGIALPIGTSLRAGGRLGTLAYSSNELDKNGKITEASDVYSLALNLFELITGKNNIIDFPALYYQREIKTKEEYEGLINDIIGLKEKGHIKNYKLIDTYKNRPDKTPSEIKDIIENSLNPRPEKRPTIDEILKVFGSIEKNYRYPIITNKELINFIEPYILVELPKSRKYRQHQAEKARMIQGIDLKTNQDSNASEFSLGTSTII